jgi:TetR/AcrR family transcriptional regulator, transcriptional repressor for nem operon
MSMRVSREEKDQSYARIVASAARLLRKNGLEGSSVADIMQDAGLTHGGFYRHFGSKDALVAAATAQAFDQILPFLERAQAHRKPADVVRDIENYYLSADHVEHPGTGCPIAALGSDFARATATVKKGVAEGAKRMIAVLAQGAQGDNARKREAAIRQLALMVGAVTLARACGADSRDEVLAACRTR